MGKQFKEITEQQARFIDEQKVFFVGTAAERGSVNISPKGMDSFRVINKNRVVWLNVTGSGNESSAHVQINPRMTIMFCAFEGSPLILRLYGQARVLHQADKEWDEYLALFPETVDRRQIFILEIDRTQNSCGMAVPFYEYKEDREALKKSAERRGKAGIENYWKQNNQKSIDGFSTNIMTLSGLNDDSDL